MITTLTLETPIGPLLVSGTEDALTRLLLPNSHAGPTPQPDEVPGPVADAASQLNEYFAGCRQTFDLPLATQGTPFQHDVWRALADIPYGETITYAELAARVGRPQACRAVGQANGSNPLPIVLPCHRVVASGGRLGGYGGGLDLKRALLALEGAATA